jgi:hypothetical protein
MSLKSDCKHDLGPAGYAEWNQWAQAQLDKGRQQAKCPACGLWVFEDAKNDTQ